MQTAFRGSACRRSEEHTSELQSLRHLVCRLLLEKNHDAGEGSRVRSHPHAKSRGTAVSAAARGGAGPRRHGSGNSTWSWCGAWTFFFFLSPARPRNLTFFPITASPSC